MVHGENGIPMGTKSRRRVPRGSTRIGVAVVDDGWHHFSGGWIRRGSEYGTWTNYWPTGRKQAEGAYRMGERTGIWTEWHANGQKAAEGPYVDGAKDTAQWTSWDSSGRELQ